MPVPDALKDRQRGYVKLASGLRLYLVCSNAQNMIRLGGMSWGLLARVAEMEAEAIRHAQAAAEAAKEGRDIPASRKPTDQEKADRMEFQRTIVAGAIKKVEVSGEWHDVDLDPTNEEEDELEWLDSAEFYEVFRIADGMSPDRLFPTLEALEAAPSEVDEGKGGTVSPDSSDPETATSTPEPARPSESIPQNPSGLNLLKSNA